MNIKAMCLEYCNYLNKLFFKVKIYNTSVKNHYINLTKYHTSRHYGILQIMLILLRIKLQKRFKSTYDNTNVKYLRFTNNVKS